MLKSYAPILVLMALVGAFAAVNLVVIPLLGRKRRNVGKRDPYECGVEPEGDARLRVSIHFYLVAVLFILFDVESVFLIPWAAAARSFSASGVGGFVLCEVVVFVLVLVLALAYAWRSGVLEWDR
jgi:NADH-quinone oxidoreductase subunit A